ncbi:MAG: hypothetical protein IPM54_14260 [Polyangiaceae bacterium]|nr:hypothetical protein [Polyangiaceae bacterium]
MHSFTTTYTCAACGKSSSVIVTGLGDPEDYVTERSREALRRVRTTENQLGAAKEGDPVDELAERLLEQEARLELRYATCPACATKNPKGVAAEKADHRHTIIFGLVFFGIMAAFAWFVPRVALILPIMDLLIFRPVMVVQVRRSNKPFPTLPFVAGILLDAALIALIVYWPRAAPFVPIAGIVQSIVRRPQQSEWKWEEAGRKLRFETGDAAPTQTLT